MQMMGEQENKQLGSRTNLGQDLPLLVLPNLRDGEDLSLHELGHLVLPHLQLVM